MPDSSNAIRVLGIAGSLRDGSYNKGLIRTAGELSPEGVAVEPFDLAGVPLYDADRDTDDARPDAVRRLKRAIDDADGLLLATPEYNHSVPGVLKNAIDWASRPAFESVLRGKPAGIIGASASTGGTARAQEHLKPVMESTLALVMPHPGVLVTRSGDKFEEGRLADTDTREFLEGYLGKLAAWVRKQL